MKNDSYKENLSIFLISLIIFFKNHIIVFQIQYSNDLNLQPIKLEFKL